MAAIEFFAPDDLHHHLRDGDFLKDTVGHAEKQFGRIIAMPNIKPPVRTTAEASEYHNRIKENSSTTSKLQVLMTLYLTDTTTPEEINLAKASGIVFAVKYYPAGATTNSEFGVTHISKVKPVLERMSELSMPLLIHGEVTDPSIDVFDREKIFIDTILTPILQDFPNLKIVMEHITTEEAAQFVMSQPEGTNLAATITAHHMLYNRNDIFRGGINPHMYCLPILKRERHRQALLQAATSGSPRFFLGTDSAPHPVEAKQSSCGCAGIFTGHAAMELYAEAFESMNALDKLEAFACVNGARFYGLPLPSGTKRRLIKKSWTVPMTYPFGSAVVKPLRAGEEIHWSIETI
eukprot:CAMPEP_0182416062 /NCGR_PEP_ID=MMETSP1167-20130531/55_1 /TAXON_ID=2988 /ORGANISM="Mallomonas Sp, Strain CCMP3275" /LENGTH=348 /DNA_ID=CAMNT_0024588387 /DNA_START=23 /DNA_END=1069 /DNA_ORIENTATION=-